MKFSRLLFSVCVLCVSAGSVQASILGGVLTFDGITDTLIDESRSAFIDRDGSLGLSSGDTIYGFVSINTAVPSGSVAPNEIAFLFAFDVSATTVSPDGVTYFTHSAPTGGLASYLDPAFAPAVTIATPGSATVADAAIVVLTNPGTYDPIASEPTNTGDLTGFTVAQGWTYEATAGFDPGSADFLHLESGVFTPVERGGFTIFDHPFGSGIGFISESIDPFQDLPGGGSPVPSSHDIVLEGTVSLLPPGGITPGGWLFTDDTNFRLNVTPEPTSMLVWSGLAIAVLAVRRRFAS